MLDQLQPATAAPLALDGQSIEREASRRLLEGAINRYVSTCNATQTLAAVLDIVRNHTVDYSQLIRTEGEGTMRLPAKIKLTEDLSDRQGWSAIVSKARKSSAPNCGLPGVRCEIRAAIIRAGRLHFEIANPNAASRGVFESVRALNAEVCEMRFDLHFIGLREQVLRSRERVRRLGHGLIDRITVVSDVSLLMAYSSSTESTQVTSSPVTPPPS